MNKKMTSPELFIITEFDCTKKLEHEQRGCQKRKQNVLRYVTLSLTKKTQSFDTHIFSSRGTFVT